MKKYLIAASAIAMGLAMSSAALADNSTDNNDNNDGSNVGNSLLSGNTVQDNSDNSTGQNNGTNQNNDNSDNSVDLAVGDIASGNSSDDDLNGSFNGAGDDNNTITANGNGDNRDNTTVGPVASNNTLSSNDGDDGNNRDNEANYNGNNRDNVNVGVEVDVEIDASTTYEDSVVSSQTLNASVTGATFDDGLALVDDQGDLNTGDISQENDAFRGFTGIATIAMDTSIGSVNQAATNVTAGSDISFD